jgi:pimeloyl-ACP methyl ester carboxylesterase
MPLLEYAAPDGVIAYVRRGLGDPVLLVHGIYPGASHHEFDRNVAALAARFTVYVPDLLGFGQSDAPRRAHSAQQHHHLLRDFVKDVIAKPAAVVGSGLGAGVATRLAVYDDAWLNRLVLLAPPNQAVYHEPPGLADRLSRFLLGTLNIGAGHYHVASSRAGLVEFLRDSYHDRRAISRETVEHMFEEANEPHKIMAYISALCGYFDTDLARWLPSVRRPTLLVVGRDRLPVPQEQWLKPTPWSQGKRLVVVDDARDFPHQEQSARVNDLVAEFLDG